MRSSRSHALHFRPAPALACALALGAPGACRAPDARPLEPRALAASLERRADTPAELARALELAGLQPLGLETPRDEDLEDPAQTPFWHAVAWAWAPDARAARRALAAARARAGSAGAPGPIEVMAEIDELSDPGAFTRVTVGFDLVGILGLGPSATARALADAETRAALGALEDVAWRTRFEVDAARARLAAARAALASLRALREETGPGRARVEILAAHGRLDEGALAAAVLAERALERRIAELELDESRAAEELAVASGLPGGSAALAAPDAPMLEELARAPALTPPGPDELLLRLPSLRLALLEYALAEARLRDEAAARWPGLRLGPHLLWRESDFLFGALVASGIPWPGSLEGRIAAASEEREAARERTEDALFAALERLAGAVERVETARASLERDARPATEESARLWTAARARFAVEPAALGTWAEALRMRADALAGLEDSRAELAFGALELAYASGPEPLSTSTGRARAEVLP